MIPWHAAKRPPSKRLAWQGSKRRERANEGSPTTNARGVGADSADWETWPCRKTQGGQSFSTDLITKTSNEDGPSPRLSAGTGAKAEAAQVASNPKEASP